MKNRIFNYIFFGLIALLFLLTAGPSIVVAADKGLGPRLVKGTQTYFELITIVFRDTGDNNATLAKPDGDAFSITCVDNVNIVGGFEREGVEVTTTAAEDNYSDIVTPGTGAALKAVVLDAGEDYTWPPAGILTVGVLTDIAATVLGATFLEINATSDLSARMVTSSGTEAVVLATHEGRTITMTGTGSAFTRTLPAATGSGAIYRFSVGVANTSNHVILVTTTDIMHGVIMSGDTDDNTTDYIWQTLADSDTVTFDGTARGGIVGDWVEFRDTSSGTWEVFGYTNSSGASEATPFSAGVS